MNVALAVKEDSKSYGDLDLEPEDVFRNIVRNLCGLFVCVIDSRIFLIHQTAKEFLAREEHMATPIDRSILSLECWKHSLQPEESNCILAQICISYLLFEVFESQPFDWDHPRLRSASESDVATDHESIEAITNCTTYIGNSRDPSYTQYTCLHDFLGYSAVYWVSHFQAAGVKAELPLSRSALQVCNPQSQRFCAWWPAHVDRDKASPLFNLFYTHLIIVSDLGLEALVLLLLEQDVDIDAKAEGWDNSTALSIAVAVGSVDVVRRSLEMHAEPNVCCEGRKPLFLLLQTIWMSRRHAEMDLKRAKRAQKQNDKSSFAELRIGLEMILRLMLGKSANICGKVDVTGPAVDETASHQDKYLANLARLLLE